MITPNLSKNRFSQSTVKIRECYQLKRKRGRAEVGSLFTDLFLFGLLLYLLQKTSNLFARACFLGSAGYRTTLCPDVRFINLHERPEPVQPARTPRKSVIDKVYRMAGGYEKGRGRGWTSTGGSDFPSFLWRVAAQLVVGYRCSFPRQLVKQERYAHETRREPQDSEGLG